jgi:hypothetical protein
LLDGTITSDGLNLTTWNIIDGRRPGTSGYYWCMGYHGILKVIEGGQLYAVLKSYNCRDSILILTRLGESSTDVTNTESRHTDEVIPKQDLTIAQMTEEVKVIEGATTGNSNRLLFVRVLCKKVSEPNQYVICDSASS